MFEKFKDEKFRSATDDDCGGDQHSAEEVPNLYNDLSSFLRPIPQIKVRIINHSPITKIKQLKASMYGKFVTIMGTVVRVTNTKPFATRLAFSCNKCGLTFVSSTFYPLVSCLDQ